MHGLQRDRNRFVERQKLIIPGRSRKNEHHKDNGGDQKVIFHGLQTIAVGGLNLLYGDALDL